MTTPPAHPRPAIVTGADSGMGKAIAELLATDGIDVAVTFHTDDTRRRRHPQASVPPAK